MSDEADVAADRVLDVREIDGPPFEDILAALAALGPDETLCLISSFEPVPLYGVLADRGFAHETSQAGPDEWQVYVEHT